MGPGYFPTVLGGILILFGLYLVVAGLRSNEKIKGSWSLRAMIVLPLAFVLFGVLMTHAGFVPALLVLIFGSALAEPAIQVGRGPAVVGGPGRGFGRAVRLGSRPALSAARRLLTPSWTCSAT